MALSEDLELVRVRIRLNTAGAEVARAGSRFWIERAAISPTGVRGLNTLLTGSYVAVAPGSVEAEPQHYFVGIDEPPAARDRSPAGLEIVLAGSHRRGLARGTVISYRGLAIGRVLSVGLAADSATVEARVYIDPQYKHLVRPESQFWYLPGFQMEAGVSGFDFHVDSLETLFRGGVAMATPEMTGPPVTTGRRFLLNSEPEEEWLEWNPTIAIGQLPELHRLPSPARARLSWQTRRLGFRRTEQELGWLLPIDTNHWLGLTTFLAPEGELREGCELELEGRVIALADASIDTLERVSRLHLPQWQPQHTQWPAARTRTPTKPEDCLVVTGNSSSQLPLAAGRLQPVEGGWSIDSSMAFDETDWQGAFVIATQDATLVGILSVEEGTGSVVFIPADVTKITR